MIKSENLSELIKESRNSKNISQRELARRINVNNAVIARIESGETKKPSFQLLKVLSEELKISLYRLLKTACYTDEEIQSLGYIEFVEFKGICGTEVIEDYMIKNDDGDYIIDIIKILNGYRDNKIDINALFGLICAATGGIDLTRYVPEEFKIKYGISPSLVVEKKYKKSNKEL